MAWMAMSIAWIAVYSGVDCSVQWCGLQCAMVCTLVYKDSDCSVQLHALLGTILCVTEVTQS